MSEPIEEALAGALYACPNVIGAWGFGSFFRGEPFRDVDVLIVVEAPKARLLATTQVIRSRLIEVERAIGVTIDPLIMTRSEYEAKPLRDMETLVHISGGTFGCGR